MNGMYGYGMNGMGFGWLIGIVVLIFVIWAITKGINTGNPPQTEKKSALDILKERYAMGEINKEEFEELKNDLL